MIGTILRKADGTVSIIVAESKLIEIDNNVRKLFSDRYSSGSCVLYPKPKEFEYFSEEATRILIALVSKGRTPKKMKNTIILTILSGDSKYYCTEKEFKECIITI